MREGSILQVGKTDNGVQTDNTVVSFSASWSILILEHMALQTLRVVKKGNPPSRSGNLITCMQCRPSLVAGSVRAPGGGGGGFAGVRGYRVTYSRYLPRPWRSSRQLSHQQATVYLGEIRQAWTGGPKEIFMPSHRARRICLSRCGGGMVSKGSREGGTGATKHSSRGVQTEASQLNLQGTCASQVGRLTVQL